MIRVVANVLWRIGACALVAWLAWRLGGPVVMVVTLPLFGIALARPLLELASELRHLMRAAVWQPLEGNHYAFHGIPIQVSEDEDHRRWVRAADVRAVVGFTASDGALAQSYPNGWRLLGKPPQPYFSDDALLEHLAKERSDRALRFRHWAEREIVFPARRKRALSGGSG